MAEQEGLKMSFMAILSYVMGKRANESSDKKRDAVKGQGLSLTTWQRRLLKPRKINSMRVLLFIDVR